MKKIILLPALIVLLLVLSLIPVEYQTAIPVKGPFLNIYTILSNPQKWEQWLPAFRQLPARDTAKLTVQKDTASFSIQGPHVGLKVAKNGMIFNIEEQAPKEHEYSYLIMPLQQGNKTQLIATEKISLWRYLLAQLSSSYQGDTHINDFKHFVETDSLLYGCRIFKTRVPEGNLVEIRQTVPAKEKFTAAHTMLTTLQQFIKEHQLTRMQPVIAQFLPKGKDSAQVNVGFFIDRETVSAKPVTFVRMPKGGPLYAARFSGKFDQRKKVYDGLQQYFTDHLYQSAILPFETYLDNQLPTSDTSHINILVNFTTYY
jgi:effector-binding domain-containing protein